MYNIGKSTAIADKAIVEDESKAGYSEEESPERCRCRALLNGAKAMISAWDPEAAARDIAQYREEYVRHGGDPDEYVRLVKALMADQDKFREERFKLKNCYSQG